MATQAVTKPATAEKTKRGTGPVVVTYIDAENKEHKRVPATISQIKVASRDGKKSKNYAVDKLSPATMKQMVGFAIAKKFDTGIRNSADDDGMVDVIASADAMWANFVEGKLYTRGEGKGGPGRTFDVQMWADILVAAYERKTKKVATEADKKKALVKVESVEGASRREMINGWLRNDPLIKIIKSEMDLKKAKESAKGKDGKSVLDELF